MKHDSKICSNHVSATKDAVKQKHDGIDIRNGDRDWTENTGLDGQVGLTTLAKNQAETA